MGQVPESLKKKAMLALAVGLGMGNRYPDVPGEPGKTHLGQSLTSIQLV